MQDLAYVVAFEHATEPMDFVRRLKKWVVPIDGGMLAFHDVVDFAGRLAGDVPDALDMFRNK